MKIDDKIRDKKIQYDIKREATKISALSSGKIDRYKYVAVEKILPPDESIIIEQAKFTYSPLGKASEKQIKTIESQGEKQMKTIEEHRKQLAESNALIRKFDYDAENDSPKILKQKEIFNNFVDERRDKILKLREKINHYDLTYHSKDKNIHEKSFNSLDNAFSFFKKINDGIIMLQKAEQNQNEFKSDLN